MATIAQLAAEYDISIEELVTFGGPVFQDFEGDLPDDTEIDVESEASIREALAAR